METSRSNRIHIAIFGKRNVGKSSLMNVLTSQEVSTVSDVLGTTTDPVYKSMELLPLGPVVFIDTAGLDDEGELGQKRVAQTKKMMNKTNIALYVFDATEAIDAVDLETINALKERKIPIIALFNKVDKGEINVDAKAQSLTVPYVKISADNGDGIDELKALLATIFNQLEPPRVLIGDLVSSGDVVILVTPIDEGAPKGRLILPQQQTIRDLLDHGAISIITREIELEETLKKFGTQVRLVVTDAQVFDWVAQVVPTHMPLTSFSILFARYKGELETLVQGIRQIKRLKANDHVLICEACTHHRQEGDIGKDKIPKLLRKLAGVDLEFSWYSGVGFPDEEALSRCDFIVHCGGCMISQKEMQYRLSQAETFKIPIVNYGVFFAYASGALMRALRPFADVLAIFDEEERL